MPRSPASPCRLLLTTLRHAHQTRKMICGIRMSGTRLVAISEVLTIADTNKPSAMPTMAVMSITANCGTAQPGKLIRPV